jgi:hypothetical protein
MHALCYMCFSEPVSWAALVASWSGCAALATVSPAWRAVALFLAVVGGMQLWEALLWRHRACTQTNATISKLGAVNNHAEPLAYFAACAASVEPASRGLAFAAAFVTVACSALLGKMTYDFWKRPVRDQCTVDRGDGLVWQWNAHAGFTKPAYALFLASLLLTTYAYLPAGANHTMAFAIASSYAASYAIYRRKAMVGSMWCFYAALLPWLLFALNARSW